MKDPEHNSRLIRALEARMPWRVKVVAGAAKAAALSHVARTATRAIWRSRARRAQSHAMPAPLFVSLTSYPPRFRTLEITLKCLLGQSLRPDRVILWVAHGDFAQLPQRVLRLQDYGLLIEPCDDLGSYKKIVPALAAYPDSFIATADDDVYYDSTWLQRLCDAYDVDNPAIICRRAHRIRLDEEGGLRPYGEWDHALRVPASGLDLLPTGEGGVLYYPGALPPDTQRADLFQLLAPNADDLWLFWMARRSGALVYTTSDRRPVIHWPGSQLVALHHLNVTDERRNDVYIRQLMAALGIPNDLAR